MLETVSRMVSRLKQVRAIAMSSPGEFRVLDRSRLMQESGDIEAEAVCPAKRRVG